jgi:hypothetical protein
MHGTALALTDMRGGDVMLFEDVTGAATHFGIAVAQTVISHRANASSNVTHAGIYDGGGSILESSGAAGLRSMQLVDKHRGYKFQVYRLNNKSVAMAAVSWAAKLINERPEGAAVGDGFGNYDTGMAVKGIFSRSNRGTGAQAAVDNLRNDPFAQRGFYCSNFVVECYELACEITGTAPVIDVDYRKVSPKLLQANLRNDANWTYEGNYTV